MGQEDAVRKSDQTAPGRSGCSGVSGDRIEEMRRRHLDTYDTENLRLEDDRKPVPLLVGLVCAPNL
jgi:hypothetical protein